jgi:hypothetical protein
MIYIILVRVDLPTDVIIKKLTTQLREFLYIIIINVFFYEILVCVRSILKYINWHHIAFNVLQYLTV